MVPAAHWTTCQRWCCQEEYLMYVYEEEQNSTVLCQKKCINICSNLQGIWPVRMLYVSNPNRMKERETLP